MNNDYEEEYEYLNMLRKSGEVNVFGAAPYLQIQFNLSPVEAKMILISWMKARPWVQDKGDEI